MWPVRDKCPLSGGAYGKGIYYVDGLCAIQILLGRDSDPPLGEAYSEGGAYRLVNTVLGEIPKMPRER